MAFLGGIVTPGMKQINRIKDVDPRHVPPRGTHESFAIHARYAALKIAKSDQVTLYELLQGFFEVVIRRYSG